MADDLTRPANDLYETDYVAWAEAQAAILRARGAGRSGLDYENLAEEVADLGKSEQHACRSQIANIIAHLLKIEFVGPPQTLPHWKGEILEFRSQLEERRTPTIDNRLRPQLAKIHARAIKGLLLRQILSEDDAAQALPNGYTWDQIVDHDWYPEPRYGE
jgi:hypothetical protein